MATIFIPLAVWAIARCLEKPRSFLVICRVLLKQINGTALVAGAVLLRRSSDFRHGNGRFQLTGRIYGSSL